jgi:hypothetical protein
MSDPNFTDPRFAPPPRDNELRRDQRLGDLEQSNAMWGWIAGGIVLALVLMFVFSNTGTNTNTAAIDNGIPPASTTNAPPRVPPPAATSAPQTQPSTTGQGGSSAQ